MLFFVLKHGQERIDAREATAWNNKRLAVGTVPVNTIQSPNILLQVQKHNFEVIPLLF
jgi:hypothetical protein